MVGHLSAHPKQDYSKIVVGVRPQLNGTHIPTATLSTTTYTNTEDLSELVSRLISAESARGLAKSIGQPKGS